MARQGKTETSNISENRFFKELVQCQKEIRSLQIQLSKALDLIEEKDEVIAKMAAQIEKSNGVILQMSEQLSLMGRQMYGTGTEKSGGSPSEGKKKSSKDDHEDTDEPGSGSRKITRPVKPVKEKKERKPRISIEEKIKALGLTPRVELHDISDEEKICDVCGNELREMGSRHLGFELNYIPGIIEVIEHRGKSYSCASCKEEARKPETALEDLNLSPVSARAPKPLLNRSWASATLMSWMIMMKVMFQMPINRLRTALSSLGSLVPTTSSLCEWFIQVSELYFTPLYQKMKNLLIERSHLQADETTLQVINESFSRKKSRSFLWQFRTVENDGFPIILFNYTKTRGGYHAAEFLRGFEGTLLVDGFSGYNKVPCESLAYCWVHARRYFIEAAASNRDKKVQDAASEAIERIDIIFAHEYCMKEEELNLKERMEYRQKNILPVVNELYQWAENYPYETLPSEKLRKAFRYLLNHKAGLKVFLDDPVVPTHNNRTEQGFVSFARGRNNWLFAYSPAGAKALGVLFSVVKTAEANGLNVFRYLNHVLETFREYRGSDIPETVIESVYPWNENMKSAFGLA